MTGKELLGELKSPAGTKQLATLYGNDGLETVRRRYSSLIEGLEAEGEVRLFSVPGRSELGGNHTDHNRGKVLAASIQLDAAAAVSPSQDKEVFFRSTGHDDVKLNLSDLSPREEERGEASALIRGIAAEFAAQGTPVMGFRANGDSRVLPGSGLSSSAAIEILFAKIFDNLYCGGKRSTLELAKIGQRAENIYFGKPCGLMDQIACASGGAVAIDFGPEGTDDRGDPKIRKINFDPEAAGFSLCVVATGGGHEDLVPDYAAIPAEMKAIAAFFGKTVLGEVDEKLIIPRLGELRRAAGDRAVLRAIHFFNENRRVDAMLAALEKLPARHDWARSRKENKIEEMEIFLDLVNGSADSSWQLLQNIYSPKDPARQNVSLALALSKDFLKGNSGHGACRVHGGGFAGTIQSYIPKERLEDYRKLMEGIFGKGSLTVLKVRPIGAAELFL